MLCIAYALLSLWERELGFVCGFEMEQWGYV
jgi:hypothetical protein